MADSEQTIIFDNVSKFYGEILGVNRVNLTIPLGITSLVGPNGAGKTTLMNLMTGLLRPSRGQVTVLGVPTDQPEKLFRKVGYCSQFDSFPGGMTGREFIRAFLKVSGFSAARLMIFPKSLWSVSICFRQLIVKSEHTAKACVSGFGWRNRSHTNLRF